MVDFQKVFKIFVASPGDLKSERELLEEVISELNDIWNNTLSINLQLIKWETKSYPGFGKDAQDVINNTIKDDYDIFIGMLWTRFGTPTKRFESGTMEEFERAYKRYKENPESVRLMIYFKDEPVNPSKLDLDQLSMVMQFRQQIEQLGGLHWSFDSPSAFTKFIRIHLSQYILGKEIGIIESTSDTQQKPILPTDNQIPLGNDEGFLDLLEKGTLHFEELAAVGERLTDSMNVLTENIGQATEDLNHYKTSGNPNDTKHTKRIINKAAQDLELFAERMEAEIPIFNKSYSIAMDAYGKAATLLSDFSADISSDIENALTTVKQIKDTMVSTKGSLISFRDTVENQPRITTRFNHAKRHAVDVLDNFDEEFAAAIMMAGEIENLMSNLIN